MTRTIKQTFNEKTGRWVKVQEDNKPAKTKATAKKVTRDPDAWKSWPISKARIKALTDAQKSLPKKARKTVEQIEAMTKGEAQDYNNNVVKKHLG